MGVYIYQAEQKTKYVPQMTVNTQDGYTATSSTQIWGDAQAWCAFFVSTQWGTDYPFHSPSIWAGNWAWSEIQLPEWIVVNNIEIWARKNESTSNLRPIAAFSLKWSNDWNTWTELKTVSWLWNSWSIWSVQNWDIEWQTTAYTYLKLEVQAKNSYVAFDYWNINWVLKDRELKNAYIGEYVWTRPSNLKWWYWRLDGNMNDSSWNLHTGSWTPHYTTDRNGTANWAYDASSSSYYVSIPNSSELYMTSGEKFSIWFWIQPHYSSWAGYTYWVISMTQNVDSYPWWSIHNDSITKTWQFRARTNWQPMGFSLSALSFNVNERFHFVITYDWTNIKYYKNATLLWSEPYTSWDCSTTYPLTIWYASTWYASWNAAYDDVFYMKDYCLSWNEIKNIYDNWIN